MAEKADHWEQGCLQQGCEWTKGMAWGSSPVQLPSLVCMPRLLLLDAAAEERTVVMTVSSVVTHDFGRGLWKQVQRERAIGKG